MRSTRHPHVTRRPANGHRPSAVVIGGGLAGMASAGLLARDGYDVELVEARDHLGGRLDTLEIQGHRFDTGPSWYLMPEVMEHFFALMGTDVREHLDLIRLDPAYRLFTPGGDPTDLHSGVDRVAELFESREPGAGRRVREHLDSAARTYELALGNFLYTGFESVRPWLRPELLRQLPALVPLLTRSLQAQAEGVAQDPVLRQMLTFHAVFLSAAPSLLPSMYHLMAHLDMGDGVLYPRGGMYRLAQEMESVVRQAGAAVRTSTRAEQILTRPGGRGLTRATVTGVRVRTPDGEHLDLPADVVVSGADLWATETGMLPRALQTFPQRYWERSRNGIGTVLGMIGVEGEVPELAHHSFFFTKDWQDNFESIFGAHPRVPDPASVYVSRPGATEPGATPPGQDTLFVLVPVPADDAIGRGSFTAGPDAGPDARGDKLVEEVLDRAIDQVSKWAGVPDLASRVRVRRSLGPADHSQVYGSYHGNALGPAHVLRQSAFLRARSASRRVDGLVYAGQTTTPGIGVPMALVSAENVLKRLHGDTSATPVPEPADAPSHSTLHDLGVRGR